MRVYTLQCVCVQPRTISDKRIARAGMCKGRFRCLKIPSRFHSEVKVANQFRTCCALYNMILAKRRDDTDWDLDIDNSGFGSDGVFYKKDIKRLRAQYAKLGRALNTKTDTGGCGFGGVGGSGGDDLCEDGWAELRDKLVAHFVYAKRNRILAWVPHAM